jgi:hypothetical protein
MLAIKAYVVQSGPLFIDLHKLDTGIGPILDRDTSRKNKLLEAECAVAGLVEPFD